jgi:hypothetical protein
LRKLIVIAADQYVRNLVGTGAFERIEDKETYYVASRCGVRDPRLLAARGERYLGALEEAEPSTKPYAHLQNIMLAFYRSRSQTMRVKIERFPLHQRLRYKLYALPGLRALLIRRHLRRIGPNAQLHALMEELRPDVVIAPSGGIDPLVLDAVRSAKALGIPSLVLAHNWDNLSSKGAFAVKPDYLGVWGEQSVEHAVGIHGFRRERVTALGAPSLDPYFRHQPDSTEPPFPFRYALFAGCFTPFDELSALRRLEDAIEQAGLELKVVYRPHPHRRPRARPDFVDERLFRHVVLDPQVRDLYLASFEEYERGAQRAKPLFPPLDYYPGLFEHAELVICPLSTMIVEAAIFERRVIVIAYDDGVHRDSPAVVIDFDHFEGIDRIEGFEVCREPEELASAFVELSGKRSAPAKPLRDQIGWWLHHDERSYAERLAELVERIGQGSADWSLIDRRERART